MNPRERLLGMGRLYLQRGEPIPVTLLAEAEQYGLSLSEYDEPTFALTEEGDIKDGENP
jgi:hypothetical protein